MRFMPDETIGEAIAAGLQSFADKLERGESIEVTTVSRCRCSRYTRTGEGTCPNCGGSGYMRSRHFIEPGACDVTITEIERLTL